MRRGSAWVNQRNAWTGFLRTTNCSEHVEVESMAIIQRHVLVPMPMSTLDETYEKEDVQAPPDVLHDKFGLELDDEIIDNITAVMVLNAWWAIRPRRRNVDKAYVATLRDTSTELFDARTECPY
ncbi:hypothetical protein CEUSTIGMA_g6607.t1 [Chlamydomonas eustigma]|uniref:Uncharacterized protein n=1 Tax=Chlamydomonas eustigma TaxID=1157962 RepID=A0A250X7X1_9CHLO|nr:hypothetical protein CEUSTIGMA_g6607.t1 [Chlamydomonas eustigma]|eukprot:GAX79167.1 hypothetical protein CEUSTIGMA_g6607.t1 [Chlamydomonas eustigma]